MGVVVQARGGAAQKTIAIMLVGLAMLGLVGLALSDAPPAAAVLSPGTINLGPAGGATNVAEPTAPLSLLDRDAGLSVPLSDGNVLWLFADTTLKINGNVAYFSGRGTGAIAPGGSPYSLHEPNVTRGWIISPANGLIDGPSAGCPRGYDDFYWPSSAVAVPQGAGRDRVLIYYQAMCGRNADLTTYWSVATGIAEYVYDAAVPPSVDHPIKATVLNAAVFPPLPGHTGPGAGYGAASVLRDGQVYVYGCHYSPAFQSCGVARTTPDLAFSSASYRYWNGSDFAGTASQAADMEMPAPLVGVKGSAAWIPDLHRFVLVDNDWPNPQLAVRFATEPQGPWTAPTMVNLPDCAGRTCRAAEIHGSLSSADNLVFTYFAEGLASGPRAVSVPVFSSPTGGLDPVASPGPGELAVSGWAVDEDTSGPINVHVYVDGTFRGQVSASGWRPDVATAHPGFGGNHGFSLRLTGIPNGHHSICAYGINVGDGLHNAQLACGGIDTGTAFGPAVGASADGRLEVFAADGSGGMAHAWQTSLGGAWSDWISTGLVGASHPVVTHDADGRLEVFATDARGALVHQWQLAPNGIWSPWTWTGHVIRGSAAIGIAPDGRLELFAAEPNGALVHQWQLAPNGIWSPWTWTGTFVGGDPAVARNQDGRLEVFAADASGALVHQWQLAPNGIWGSWWWTGGFARGTVTFGTAPDGRLELFAMDSGGGLNHQWQLAPNGIWSAWTWTGAIVGAPSVAGADADGRLELFAIDRQGRVIRSAQIAPNSVWTAWATVGIGSAQAPAVAPDALGRLTVLVAESTGAMRVATISVPGGALSAWGRVPAS